jgi:hypothetical protein
MNANILEQSNPFLPEGYEAPVMGGGYMKLIDGDNVFRVLSSAIVGYEYWTTENKPIRSKTAFTETPNIKTNKDGSAQKVKHFWAFTVWNYQTKSVEILQLTQASIQGAITNLVKDEDWGDPKGYDIKISRSGSGIETEYAVNPKPHKEISEDIKTAYSEKKINLEALYSGENPFV